MYGFKQQPQLEMCIVYPIVNKVPNCQLLYIRGGAVILKVSKCEISIFRIFMIFTPQSQYSLITYYSLNRLERGENIYKKFSCDCTFKIILLWK